MGRNISGGHWQSGQLGNSRKPPYCLASGNYARLIGINKVGLRRQGFSDASIQGLHRAFAEVLRGHGDRKARLERLLADRTGTILSHYYINTHNYNISCLYLFSGMFSYYLL
ncbi:MAG: hypothetical protein R6U35_01125 [Candidatus Humimicrobiaceae bacterium]